MKKFIATLAALIMIFACFSVSVSASASIDVDESLTDASEYVAPNAKTRVVTYYTPNGDPMGKLVCEYDEKTNTETLTKYENNDGEMVITEKEITVYTETGENNKYYRANSEGELILVSEDSVSMSGNKLTSEYAYYDSETGNPDFKGESEEIYDDEGRLIKNTCTEYDADGKMTFKVESTVEYSADGNTSVYKEIIDYADGMHQESYHKQEITVNGDTTTIMFSESEDGVNYVPGSKTEYIYTDELHYTVKFYAYDSEMGEWILNESSVYELDSKERKVSDFVEMGIIGNEYTHIYAADGSNGTHTASYEDEYSSFAQKIEESFIDRYKRSLIKASVKEDDGEWLDEYEFVFEYNDAEKTYKVSAYQYCDDAGGNKVLTEYAIVEYDLVEEPEKEPEKEPEEKPEEKKEENPESGDFISAAVTLMSFASIAGASLVTRRKFK